MIPIITPLFLCFALGGGGGEGGMAICIKRGTAIFLMEI